MNNHAQLHTKYQCNLVEPVDLIIVYSGWGHIAEPSSQHVSYSKECGWLFNQYQLMKSYSFPHEQLRIYEKKLRAIM